MSPKVVAYIGARPDHRQMRSQIESARRVLQNGNPGEAARLAREAVRIADTAAPVTTVMIPATNASYRGAAVLDPNGNRLGT